MTIDTAIRDACFALDKAGVENVRNDARLLMRHVLGVSLEQLLMEGDRELTPAQAGQFDALVGRRVGREPMAQILGLREFWGHVFKVTKDTLDPRPDSETLIAALLQQAPDRSKPLTILDLGTGTGCLLLSALSEYPRATGLGVDISEEALAVARGNARSLGLENRAEFKKSDWNCEINGVWDVIISNPPYIPREEIPRLAPEVAVHEPRLALDGGSDGLECYRTITCFLPKLLAEGGMALLEIGAGQAPDVQEMVLAQGLKVTQIARDLADIERCVVIQK